MEKGKLSRQAASGGAAMAAAIVLSWVMRQAGLEVPGEITVAMATVIGYIGGRIG